jgi:S-adenosylmethionine:tRNA ribosyltransferase-isomerase
MSIAPVKLASKMKLSHYNFSLPQSLIAQFPAADRDEAKLLVLHRRTQKLEHKRFKDLINYFGEDDVLVLNNARVFPARLYANKEKTGARIEVLLLHELDEKMFLWDTLVDPARKIRISNKIFFGEDELVAEVIDNTTSRGRTLRFLYEGTRDELVALLSRLGEPPLPKQYISREITADDRERYQTVYAKQYGTVSPPYAGLNFSREMLMRLRIKGIGLTEITMHLGTGSFAQIGVDDLGKHKPSAEQIIIPEETAKMVNKARQAHKRVCAVGTTVFRALEDQASPQGIILPCDRWSSRFIFPPYTPQAATHLLTTFHMPKSMMMMTTSAFAGFDLLKEAYRKAIKERYKWGCYGDSMLIMD